VFLPLLFALIITAIALVESLTAVPQPPEHTVVSPETPKFAVRIAPEALSNIACWRRPAPTSRDRVSGSNRSMFPCFATRRTLVPGPAAAPSAKVAATFRRGG
jgi:hypothetical protein